MHASVGLIGGYSPVRRHQTFKRACIRLLTYFALVALIELSSCKVCADVIWGGEFETFTNGTPGTWQYTRGDGPADLQSFDHSPFGSSSAALLLIDGDGGAGPFLQGFNPSEDPYAYVFSFDFRLDELTGNPWELAFRGLSVAIDAPGNHLLVNGTEAFTITAGVWYHFRARVNIYKAYPLGTWAGLYIDSGMLAEFWAPSGPFQGGSGPPRIRDISGPNSDGAGRNGNLLIDNMSSNAFGGLPTGVIPEPSSALIAFVSGGLLLGVRRRDR